MSLTVKQQSRLNLLARKIIEKNQYISLATSDNHKKPWISPVVYANDQEMNLYFISLPSSRHCKNINSTHNLACAIFDSHQQWGKGVGLQIEAECKIVGIKDTLKAAKIYFRRKYPYGKLTPKMATNYIRKSLGKMQIYRFYKIIPKTVWMNNPYSKIDERVKVRVQ